MNFNIAHTTVDQAFVYLLKINPEKPFGSFKIKFIMKEIDSDQIYKGNTILMKAHKTPYEIDIIRRGGEDDNIDEVQLSSDNQNSTADATLDTLVPQVDEEDGEEEEENELV